MNRLCELANKYRTDKTPTIYHSYTPFYYELFKTRNVKKLLEIGIGSTQRFENNSNSCMSHVSGYTSGASLFMWEEYFPEADIYALDVVEDILINKGRIKSYYCDQGEEASLLEAIEHIGTGFDVVIDDGSHQTRHQILTANTLIPRILDTNGVYIIEDVGWPDQLTAELNYEYDIVEFNIADIFDDRLVIIYGI